MVASGITGVWTMEGFLVGFCLVSDTKKCLVSTSRKVFDLRHQKMSVSTTKKCLLLRVTINNRKIPPDPQPLATNLEIPP